MSKIPKVIHYCWFGGNPIPETDKAYIESWKKLCPDFTIMEWNESNYDVTKNRYMKEAYEAKKWGFVPDYARLDIIYEHGGIYLDTDIEIVRSLDPLLEEECFMGFEDDGGDFVALGLGFGAVKGNEHIRKMRDVYEDVSFINEDGTLNTLPSPSYTTDYLETVGLEHVNKFQKIDNVTIYPKDYFCPKDYHTGKLTLTENTYTIHQYHASWYTDEMKRAYNRKLFLIDKLGVGMGNKVNNSFIYYDRFKSIVKEEGFFRVMDKINKRVFKKV